MAATVRAAAAALLWLVAGLAFGDEDLFREDQVKAAFLFSFTKYIEWPAGSFRAAYSPAIGIGLFCDDSLRPVLEEVVRGRRVNGRAVEVRTLARPADARREHVVFVCATHERELEDILRAVQGAPVVVVGESDRFWQAGGMINLVRVGDKLRFSIDLPTAALAGVKMSAELQKLALTLQRNGAGP